MDAPLFGQLPILPADPSVLPGMAAPDGQAGQPATDPAPGLTAGGQLAAESFTVDAGNGQPGDAFEPLGVIPVGLPTLGLSG